MKRPSNICNLKYDLIKVAFEIFFWYVLSVKLIYCGGLWLSCRVTHTGDLHHVIMPPYLSRMLSCAALEAAGKL